MILLNRFQQTLDNFQSHSEHDPAKKFPINVRKVPQQCWKQSYTHVSNKQYRCHTADLNTILQKRFQQTLEISQRNSQHGPTKTFPINVWEVPVPLETLSYKKIPKLRSKIRHQAFQTVAPHWLK